MKKRILAFFVCLAMALPLMACNRGTDLPYETQIPIDELDSEVITGMNGCGGDTMLADDTYDAETANAAAMDFSVRLFQKYAELVKTPGAEEPNLLISPISVYLALGMLENGAKSETLAELEEVLGLNVGQMNCFAKEYMNQIPEELKIANSIWYTSHERFTVKKPFIQSVEGYYDS